jgi:hypothetical protein
MNELVNYPVCGPDDARYFLRKKNVSVHQNLIMNDAQSVTRIARGDLDMVVCHMCCLAGLDITLVE